MVHIVLAILAIYFGIALIQLLFAFMYAAFVGVVTAVDGVIEYDKRHTDAEKE